jgi:hypothetical protein
MTLLGYARIDTFVTKQFIARANLRRYPGMRHQKTA